MDNAVSKKMEQSKVETIFSIIMTLGLILLTTSVFAVVSPCLFEHMLSSPVRTIKSMIETGHINTGHGWCGFMGFMYVGLPGTTIFGTGLLAISIRYLNYRRDLTVPANGTASILAKLSLVVCVFALILCLLTWANG